MPRIRSLLAVFALVVPSLALADPVSDVARSSIFTKVDLGALAGGKVLTGHGPTLPGPRDLAVQALYIVHAPVARALELHKNWDASRHKELEVYVHHDFSHAAPGEFSQPLPENGLVRKLEGATARLPSIGDLQLSKAEAGGYKGDFHAFWSQVLLNRASAFARGGLGGLPPYETAGGSIKVGEETSRLLREQPAVRAYFKPAIEHSPLGGGSGGGLPQYWELLAAGHEPAFALGASGSVQANGGAQYFDIQYYASGGYYVYVTLYQLWPVTIDGKEATLVWRVDSISTESVDLSPTARMGSGAAFAGEVQRMIKLFQGDVGR